MKLTLRIILALSLTVIFNNNADSCTNVLVTKGATVDGSTMITYNADAGGFMEPLYFLQAADHQPGEMLDIYDWDSGKYLGKIKQIPHTYKIIGNMNEYQVSIGETTFTGREELKDTNALIDYGSLIYLGLQRAKTAREAIKVMTDLVEEYGYYSSGESFSVSDPNEVWMLEMISKGPDKKGAVWAARRIPDGMIAAHANQARIRELLMNDPENCLYAKDVIDFAIEKKYYDPKSGQPFSFADTYNPLDVGSLFACEGRVWSIFRRAAPSLNLSADYWRGIKGEKPYPLFIKPDKKLSVADVIALMRDHFEGTEFDATKGSAAGSFGCPIRNKPLVFKLDGDTTTEYYWERPISTQQTAFAFVSQSRSFMPNEIGGVFWYGVDDNYTNVYIPLYCSMTQAPECFNKYSIKEFSLESGFWVFNLVANLAYTKYSYMLKDIQPVQLELETKFQTMQPIIENAAMELYKKDPKWAIEYLTEYSVNQSNITVQRWRKLWEFLVMKYNDGYVNDVTKENGRHPKGVGYGNEFNKRAVDENPSNFKAVWKDKKDKKKKK